MDRNEIAIRLPSLTLKGELNIPEQAVGLVIFSHGSGSSRLSPRNKFVAELIRKHHFGTLLFDLLTEEEDQDYDNRFDIELLTKRLIAVTEWIQQNDTAEDLPIGYFGASTGAASALGAAAYFGTTIKAVVSRGGRPDLTTRNLLEVETPTLFVVGGFDLQVLQWNKMVYNKLQSVKKMEIVEGASHLFEEPGKIEEVAALAIRWYEQYLK